LPYSWGWPPPRIPSLLNFFFPLFFPKRFRKKFFKGVYAVVREAFSFKVGSCPQSREQSSLSASLFGFEFSLDVSVFGISGELCQWFASDLIQLGSPGPGSSFFLAQAKKDVPPAFPPLSSGFACFARDGVPLFVQSQGPTVSPF